MIAAYEKPFLERVEKILRALLQGETPDALDTEYAALYLAMGKAFGTGYRPVCIVCDRALEHAADGPEDAPGWYCRGCIDDAYDGPECDQEGNLL